MEADFEHRLPKDDLDVDAHLGFVEGVATDFCGSSSRRGRS
jgi:hypothetical protein